MRFLKRAFAALLALTLCAAQGVCAEQVFEDFDQLNEQVDRVFSGARAVGGAFIVAKEGEIVYERYYGVQQKSKNTPVTPKSYFRCASVTKLVTGIGVQRLMDEGVLSPDEDISAYLGYTVRNPRYPDVPITLRMLMSHTSGINEDASFNKQSSRLREMIDVEQKALANFKDVVPGTRYDYSNFGAGVVGSIIECVTGQDLSSYMREAVFSPLGIDAAYSVTQLLDPECICATYDQDGELVVAPSYLLRQEYKAEPLPDEHYRLSIGSLYIRPRDLARLGIAMCADGTVDGVRVLSEAAIARMRQAQSPEENGITADTPYSFFTIRQDTLLSGRRVYGHQGTSEGIVCNLYFEPESELVLVVMSNGCRTAREDGVMRMSRKLAALAEEAFLKNAPIDAASD